MTILKSDYLIIGAGACGMAFADTIIAETDKTVTLIDRRAKPGGHWNEAYPFVTLHQPSAFYGVSSKELSNGMVDKVGLNKGLADLASGAEILAYFDDVMRHTLLPSGRVNWLPMSDYLGDSRVRSRISGKETLVEAETIVDAGWFNTSIPATHTPSFTIEDGVKFMPLNDLPKVGEPPEGFTVIGGGKTAIDACLWLLEMGVEPDHIRWIMPRDGWLLDRESAQPSMEFFEKSFGIQAAQYEAIAASTSMEDMFDRLEACGYFLRIDETVRPKMFHGATISRDELAELRRIKNIIRMGRVSALKKDRIVLDEGEIPTSPEVIHVDCSARAIPNDKIIPVFQEGRITIQTVRSYQPIFSAALIAHIEATRTERKEKNRLCQVVPLPNHDTDYVRFTAINMLNQYNWGKDKDLRGWLTNNRLDGFMKVVSAVDPEDGEKMAILDRFRTASMPAMAKLQGYISELGEAAAE